MGRKRLHLTQAAKQAAYRQRNPDRPKSNNNLERLEEWKERNPEKWRQAKRKKEYRKVRKAVETKPFCAIDGEGYTDKSGKHRYVMLSASSGRTIEDWKNGLSTKDCLKFVLYHSDNNILVGFYINYDINMLLKDIDKETLSQLWDSGECYWNDYVLRWQPSKSLWIYQRSTGRSAIWYDVFGFFQKSFIKSLKDWNLDVPKEIEEGKAARKTFSKKERETIRKYNLIECELLVELMQRVRKAMIEANALPAHWHGAGAIATALFQRYKVRAHNSEPNALLPHFARAYFGGRNQILLQGEIDSVYTHDINSAYPYGMAQLPSALGYWDNIDGYEDYPWTLYYVEWNLPKKSVLTPFPFRHKRAIYWPQQGAGYYWHPEVKEALKFYGSKYIKVKFGYKFYPDNDCKPFAFLPELYEQRKQFIRQGSDAQLILKLGINACYGKVAQSIGYKGARPAYQNYFWAGWITSLTRSMVFELASRNPDSVCSFATDGVVATAKLTDHSKEKTLGAWEVAPASNFFCLQSGVYCFADERGNEKIRSRGFAYRSVDYNELRKIWRKDGPLGKYEYKEVRFIGLGNSLRSKVPLENWGNWITQDRHITFMPNGNVDLTPKKVLRVWPIRKVAELSEQYELKQDWFDGEEGRDYLSDMEQ